MTASNFISFSMWTENSLYEEIFKLSRQLFHLKDMLNNIGVRLVERIVVHIKESSIKPKFSLNKIGCRVLSA